MSVRSGQSVTVVFPTQNPSTGAAVNADSTPTGTVYKNGTADAATVTVTNLATGLYKAAVSLPGLAIGDVVELSVAATVNGVAGKGVVWRDVCDIALGSFGTVTVGGYAVNQDPATYVLDSPVSGGLGGSVLEALEQASIGAGKIGTPANATVSADIAAVKSDTGTLVTRITSTLFAGITSLAKWLGALAGKAADTATRAEIQATPAGATYNETTDSQEALRDRGDSGAWGVAGSGSLTIEQDEKLTSAYNQTLLISSGGFYVVNRLNNGNLTIFQGETWSFAEGTHHTITRQSGDTWPTDLTDYTITSTITKTLANTNTGSLSTLAMPCTITQATGASQSFYIEAGTSTASLALGEGTRGYDWTVSAAKGTNVAVLVAGTASVKRRL